MRPKRNDTGLAAARGTQAFTRLELAAALAAVGLLALLALPSLANQRERSGRLLCVNNLRLVGQALQQFATEHGDRLPWRTPYCEGGTMPDVTGSACLSAATPPSWLASINNSWFQWSWLSNELRTPKILACPSDAQKRLASEWSVSASGGFLNFAFLNNAVSYLLGLDVIPETRDGLVAGDRNLRFNLGAGNCSAGVTGVQGLIARPGSPGMGIGDGLHVEAGNYLFTDGRVQELSSRAFSAQWPAISAGQNDGGAAHFLTP